MWCLLEGDDGSLHLGLGAASLGVDRVVQRCLCLGGRAHARVHEAHDWARLRPVARVRVVAPEDEPIVLAFGYDAWGKGPVDEFVRSYDRSNHHLRGRRYLIESLGGEIWANLNTLRFSRSVVGVASVATAPAHRRRGHVTRLLRAVLALVRDEEPSARFLLFSEVDPRVYEAVGFARVPDEHQRHLPVAAMATDLEERPLTAAEARFLVPYF